MNPSVFHLVISLAPGGLERLVVDWTNARNRRLPGSTRIACLDELGAMVGQVDDGSVSCVNAHRFRFPWDHAAVRTVVKLLSCRVVELLNERPFRQPLTTEQPSNSTTTDLRPPVVLHAHNLSAWQYAVLAKLQWTINKNSNMDIQDTQDKEVEASFFSSSCKSCLSMLKTPSSTMKEGDVSREAPSTSWFDSAHHRSGQAAKSAKQSVRLIYTQHGANVHNMRLRDRIRARLLACFTDEIVAVSDATADVMAKAMWVPRRRIKVVVNGVAGSQGSGFRSQPALRSLGEAGESGVRSQAGIPENAFVIGSVGRLAHVKGQDRLIAAFEEEKKFEQKPAKDAKPLRQAQGGEEGILPRRHPASPGNTVLRRAGGDTEGESGKENGGRGDEAATHGRECCSDSSPRRVAGISDSVLRILNTRNIEFSSLSQSSSDSVVKSSSCPVSSTAWSEYFLLFVGDGPERANLERQAAELGVADRVLFVGYQSDPAPYLAAMDLFVLPSRSEGVSVALLEAMAAGVPVAVTDVGANREVVDNGRCGVILPEDETQWLEAITALITDPKTTTQRIQAAQQRVRTHYSLDATLDGYERLYGGASGD